MEDSTMKKKEYMQPTMEVMEMQQTSIVCDSKLTSILVLGLITSPTEPNIEYVPDTGADPGDGW